MRKIDTSINKVVSDRILLEIDIKDDNRRTKSEFIHILESTRKQEDDAIVHSTDMGRVVQVGPESFCHMINSDEPFCFEGDLIFHIPNAGYVFEDKALGKWFRIIRAGDVLAILKEAENNE